MDFDEFVREQEEKEKATTNVQVGCSPTTAACAGLIRSVEQERRWQDYMHGGYPGLEDVYWE